MVKERYLKKKITSGPIGSGKLLIMVYKYNYPNVLRHAIDEHIKKYDQDTGSSYCRISVKELNRLVEKHIDCEFEACNLRVDTWDDVVRHLLSFVQYGASMEFSTIDELVAEFFRYMPFFDYSPDRVKTIYEDLGFGYCCEDCDGEYEEFKESRKVHNLHSYGSYLSKLEIKLIHK